MIWSGLYGLLLTAACYKATRFKQIFMDFKVEIPAVTQLVLSISHVVWDDYVWVVLLPLSIVWPLVVVQFLPVPKEPEIRRRIVRTARFVVVFIYLITMATLAFALFAPMLALINDVAGPQKK